MLKLSKTISPQKLFSYDCITLYNLKIFTRKHLAVECFINLNFYIEGRVTKLLIFDFNIYNVACIYCIMLELSHVTNTFWILFAKHYVSIRNSHQFHAYSKTDLADFLTKKMLCIYFFFIATFIIVSWTN